ncbi:uncharacterized protein BDW70DRAFT_166008 [Aspergillus foveolatus]|uniref:uncharacterized protein n=1 Tax=Aspergillus foveolatus TaxID=210207 RepID=UPI003CCDAC5D
MGMSLEMRDRMWGSYVVRFSRGNQVRSLDRSRDERERSGSAEGETRINISKARGHRRGQKIGRKEEKRLYTLGAQAQATGHWTADGGHKGGGADEPRVGNPSKSGASPGATAGQSPLQTACLSTGEIRLNHIDEGGVSSRGVWIVTVRGMLDRYAHDQLTNPTPADYEMCDLAG